MTNESLSVVDLLLSDGDTDCNNYSENEFAISPLHSASRKMRKKVILQLIQAGAEVDITDNRGVTPMQILIANDCEEVLLELFLRNGANTFNRADAGGDTALCSCFYINPVGFLIS